MKRRTAAAICAWLIGLGGAAPAQAALLSRLGGLAVYDTDLDITWLADGDANGLMTWHEATAWAAGLTVGGATDWRLPTTLVPDASCTDDTAGTSPSSDPLGFNCTGSELGHLFYVELGGAAGSSILTSGDPDLALFSNLKVDGEGYWSSTELASNTTRAYTWNLANGGQSFDAKFNPDHAIAVRSGDVALVPEPAAALVIAVALAGLGARAAGGARR